MIGGAAKRLEDAATSVPFVGDAIRRAQRRGIEDLNRVAWNEALSPIGPVIGRLPANTAAGHEAIATAERMLSDRYASVVPSLKAAVDAPLTNAIQAAEARIPQARVADFRDAVRRHVTSLQDPSGAISGTGLQQSLQGLRSEANRLQRGSGSYDYEVGAGLRDVIKGLEASATRRSRAITRNFKT
jgi:hypothetical protein